MTGRSAGDVRRRRVRTNGVELDVVEAGRPGDPLVLLSHGFPECSHSWRHQLAPLAAAGYHVLAPDQRGYGRSDAPDAVDAYASEQLALDLLGLADDAGADDVILVGHDWGALVAWDLAVQFPERLQALVAVSVPYPAWPAPPTLAMRHVYGDEFFYILYFQDIGPPEAELEADVRRTLHHMLWSASGDNFPRAGVARHPAAGTGLLDVVTAPDDLEELPPWLTPHDLDAFTESFEASGFFGPISWYRNLDADFDRLQGLALGPERITMPVLFVAGTNDLTVYGHEGRIEAMRAQVPGLRDVVLLDGIGHWTQQEDPEGFNAALLAFLAEVAPGATAG